MEELSSNILQERVFMRDIIQFSEMQQKKKKHVALIEVFRAVTIPLKCLPRTKMNKFLLSLCKHMPKPNFHSLSLLSIKKNIKDKIFIEYLKALSKFVLGANVQSSLKLLKEIYRIWNLSNQRDNKNE